MDRRCLLAELATRPTLRHGPGPVRREGACASQSRSARGVAYLHSARDLSDAKSAQGDRNSRIAAAQPLAGPQRSSEKNGARSGSVVDAERAGTADTTSLVVLLEDEVHGAGERPQTEPSPNCSVSSRCGCG